MIGRNVAARVIAEHGTSDLRTLVEQEGLVVKTRHPWEGSFEDAYVHPVIYVPKYLASAEFRSRVAHCLGHHFLHPANQVWLRGFDRIWSWKCEYQAEEFAAWILIPEAEAENASRMNSVEIAAHYRVDQRLAEVRMRGRLV